MNSRDERNGAITKHQTHIINAGVWRCCLNCAHWDHGFPLDTANGPATNPHCGKFDAVPPPAIIVHGCRDHETDIPF